MRTLLIDDEPAATILLQRMIETRHPELTVVGKAADVVGGLQLIRREQPELMFLDVEMPGGDGFELIRQLTDAERPEVIFVTSHADYAYDAFNCAALGFVLKPVEPPLLASAIARARQRISEKNSASRLSALLANIENTDNNRKQIGIPSERGVEFVRAADVIYCRGNDGYTDIVLTDGRLRTSAYPVGYYVKILPQPEFCAVHRSYIVNRNHVMRAGGQRVLLLSNGDTVEYSRRRTAQVNQWLK